MITDLKNLSLKNSIIKKNYNKILDEMNKQNQMLPIPKNLEDFQQYHPQIIKLHHIARLYQH